MTLKIHPVLATAIIAGILILSFALFKGCKQSKLEVAAKEKAQRIADSALALLKESKIEWDSSAKDFQDSLEFERGQKELIAAQKERTEGDLDKALSDNKELIARHHLADYNDTATIIVPNGYVNECEECFTKLDNTTKLSLKYKDDVNKLERKWTDQNRLYDKRFKQLSEEKLGLYNKVNALAKEAKNAADKLQPHGKLYLSWGVLWKPFPWAGGAGLLYQSKYNIIYGAKWYYSSQGHIIETTINFPLSVKFR